MGQMTGMPELDAVHPESVEGCDSSPLLILFKDCDAMDGEVGQAENE